MVRVYIRTENVAQRVQAPEETTLASFFRICTQNEFSHTPLHQQMYAANSKYIVRNFIISDEIL
ncbi:hypothetical protein AVEN_264893-1, partial [Araneus ventricosus]